MRIIAGEHRGRRLTAPPGLGTRPMLDRVREALFSTLGPGIEGAYALDLFAGSGSLGFEALSRGAAHARFVEKSPGVVSILEDNAQDLGVAGKSRIVCDSALSEGAWEAPEGEPRRWADVIFFDPPYPMLKSEDRSALFQAVRDLTRNVLRPGGLLVFHTPRRGVTGLDFDMGPDLDQRIYGSSALWYLRGDEEVAT
jgi:16S rRNA (guanine966-N2)-methyltransferase